MKLGIYNYVEGTTARKITWRCDNVDGLGELVICHMFRFLSIPFFFFLLFSLLSTCGLIAWEND